MTDADAQPIDPGHLAVGVDVGGSGIKVGVVDVARGELLAPRLRVATPVPSTPALVVPAIVRTVRRAIRGAAAAASVEIPADAPIGVGVPCVVIDGVTKTAANIDAGWIDFDARAAIETAVKRPTLVLNDADAAGLAEMRFGAGLGEKGVVFVLTLGTGVGSGLFNDGVLVPNTELGRLFMELAEIEWKHKTDLQAEYDLIVADPEQFLADI